jgi:hypothetical protein
VENAMPKKSKKGKRKGGENGNESKTEGTGYTGTE